MEKNIILETIRIKEIMGLQTKPLLVEQVAEFIRELLAISSRGIRSGGRTLRITSAEERLFLDAIEGNILGDAMKEAQYAALIAKPEGQAVLREFEALATRLKGTLPQNSPMVRIYDDLLNSIKDPKKIFSKPGGGGGGLNPNLYTSPLPAEVEALFGVNNLRAMQMTQKEIDFLQTAYRQIEKGVGSLSRGELIALESEMRQLGLDLNVAVNRWKQAGDLLKRERAANAGKFVDWFNNFFKKGSEFKAGQIAMTFWNVTVIIALLGAYDLLASYPLFGKILPRLPYPLGGYGETTTPATDGFLTSPTGNSTTTTSPSSSTTSSSTSTTSAPVNTAPAKPSRPTLVTPD